MADLIPPRRDEPITEEGRSTQRFAEYLEDLARFTNGTVAAATSTMDSRARSLLSSLQEQVGSGDFLTSDETGFTVDTDKLSVDMDEA